MSAIVKSGNTVLVTPYPPDQQSYWRGKMATSIMPTCQQCGTTFTRKRYQWSGFCSTECRFLSKVDKSGGDDACWPYGTHRDGHYGEITVKKHIRFLAHRFSWELVNGQIADGLFVCHRCDNPKCVNPNHLFLGTQKDNMQDKVRKKRYPKAMTEDQYRLYRIAIDAPEWRDRRREIATRLWADPAFRTKMLEARERNRRQKSQQT